MAKIVSTLILLLLIANTGYAAEQAAFCYAKDADQLDIQGLNIDKLLPIASVSKVVTSYWAVANKGVNYRFTTSVYVTKISSDTADIHLEGSRDPYFGKESLHFLISQLNQAGITKVRTLTYDENFKFYWNPRSDSLAASWALADDPGPKTVKRELTTRGSLLTDYAATLAYVKQFQIKMVEKPQFKVEEVSFLKRADYQPQSSTMVYPFRSSQLFTLLKEMNRNSNNNAAEQIFAHLGGPEKFAEFIKKDLELTDKEIHFVNGSGNNLVKVGAGVYNKASCATMLKIIKNFKTRLNKENKRIGDVLSVAGINTGTINTYNSETTNGSLAAKTGTVSPNVTLGGIINTQQGLVYFMFNQSANGSRLDWKEARKNMKNQIIDLIKQFDGGKPLSASNVAFISFDKDLQFTLDDEDTNSLQ